MGKKKVLYDPASLEPFRLSRSKLEKFIECPRCFYLEVRHGISSPSGPPYTLNLAVDHLLKKEFDLYHARKEPPPFMKECGIAAVPFQHPQMEEWRNNFKGVQYYHEPTRFLVCGAVDDLWQAPGGELIVVDYKATGGAKEPTLDEDWKKTYKRQIEIYQWLLRQNGFPVAATAYFLFARVLKAGPAFDGRLDFKLTLLPHTGDGAWVDQALRSAHQCPQLASLPVAAADCKTCAYRRAAQEREGSELCLC